MRNLSPSTVGRIKIATFLLCLAPLLWLCVRLWSGTAGADPVRAITRTTGLWTLNLLGATLAITPLRIHTGWFWLTRLRRTIALYSFFYATLHVLAYLMFDHSFDWPEIARDIGKKPYLIAGALAFLMLIPLAVTSTDGMMRRLGGKRWKRLHQLVFPIAIAAVFHFLWLVKRDITEPGWYAIGLCLLFSLRALNASRQRSRNPAGLGARSSAPLG